MYRSACFQYPTPCRVTLFKREQETKNDDSNLLRDYSIRNVSHERGIIPRLISFRNFE